MLHVESLFSPPAPPELLGGAELHLIEYHHIDSDTNWRTATMVVNFDDTPAARQSFSALRSTFVSARYPVHGFSGPEGVAQMCGCLRVQPFGTADAVLYTAGNRAITIETLQATLDAIRAMGRGLVVVVDDDSVRWRALQNVSGFVRGAESTSPSTAAAVAGLLATLCAPETLACTDYEDVESCLGDWEQPAVLAEAIWFRRRETLEFASAADGDFAKGADSIVVNICAASLRIRDLSLILRAVGACMAPSGSLILQAPVNNSIRPWLHPSLVSLSMICLAPKSVVSLCPPADAAVTELVARFPRLFRGNEPCARSFLPLGWKQLIFEPFQDIDRLLSDAHAASFETLQVKEKLGRLRVSVRCSGTFDAQGDPEARLRALVTVASDRSETVCQICGRLSDSKDWPRLSNVACAACFTIQSQSESVAGLVGT